MEIAGFLCFKGQGERNKIVAGLPPAEKIGQMMMNGIKGKAVNDDSLYMLHEYGAASYYSIAIWTPRNRWPS